MTVTPDILSRIQSAARGNEDLRLVLTSFLGTNQASGANPKNLAAPPLASFSVAAANGLYTYQITNPSNAGTAPIYHEVSYSPVKNFSQGVITLPVTTATGGTIASPGASLFFRLRSSRDSSTWNSYQLAQQAAANSGLVSSSAMVNNSPLNQSNFANVDSIANGGSAAVRIYGVAGPYHSYVQQKGPAQFIRPSGTIANVTYGSTKVVAFDGEKFRVSPILPGVFHDDWEPVGIVSVVESGVPTLPTVALVLGTGGAVIAWNVTSQGNGLTGPVTLTINTTTGSGASAGNQTIQNGKLISIAPGNPGTGYAAGDTVTVSGGIGAGQAGGGGVTGSNGGRLIQFGA
jgi:hypothetical protein